MLGPDAAGAVPYVDAAPKMSYGPYNNTGQHDASGKISWPGFTGLQHAPFSLEGDVGPDLVLNGIDLSRLDHRRALLTSFSRFQERVPVDGLDTFQQQAFGVLTSGRLIDALDLEQEDPKIRERYGRSTDRSSFRRSASKCACISYGRAGWSKRASAA